ncbi:MAG: polysaccharide pyruvyl transferase family protein, partial [Candidatus Cloacimonetes bacterium]|nr:polysaccharide pyruvyl transferase family protein [Candidatus Cloacimonadota bacterium]
MVRFFISGYYGLDNIGDEAILSGMISSLKKKFDNPTFTVLTNNALITQSLHNVNSIEHSLKKGSKYFVKNIIIKNAMGNIIKETNKCDVFILGGGSLLQDLKAYYLPVLLSQLKLAQILKKKTVVYGIGAGPIDTRVGKILSHSILNTVDLVTVRDGMSKQVLESCGVQNVIQTADPAFGMDLPDNELFDLSGKDIQMNSSANTFATTSYNWLHDSDIYRNLSNATPDLNKRRVKFAKIYDTLLEDNNRKLLFVPTVKGDLDGYLEIQKMMRCNKNTQVMDFSNNINRVISCLSRSDILVGM